MFDASALIALFGGHERVSALWFDAEAVGVAVLLPATAIGEANRTLQATDNAWSAVLLGPNVYALDLSPTSALGASRHHGDLATAHAAYEAVATDATIVTGRPEAYDPLVRTVTF